MANQKLIDALNKGLSLEIAGSIQYMQHSFLITGPEREVFRDFFRAQAKEAHDHTIMVGDKIVALGGVPTVEPAMIRQATNLTEMLEQNLELEREALNAYLEAHSYCTDKERPTQFQLEERIAEEQEHVEEMEKMTNERKSTITTDRITLRQIS